MPFCVGAASGSDGESLGRHADVSGLDAVGVGQAAPSAPAGGCDRTTGASEEPTAVSAFRIGAQDVAVHGARSTARTTGIGVWVAAGGAARRAGIATSDSPARRRSPRASPPLGVRRRNLGHRPCRRATPSWRAKLRRRTEVAGPVRARTLRVGACRLTSNPVGHAHRDTARGCTDPVPVQEGKMRPDTLSETAVEAVSTADGRHRCIGFRGDRPKATPSPECAAPHGLDLGHAAGGKRCPS